MNYFWEKNKYFFAIIIGAIIIGCFLYSATKNGGQSKVSNVTTQKIPTILSSPIINQNLKIKPALSAEVSTKVGGLQSCGASTNTIVTKVIDGDTVVVEGGWHVRLLGMDADEKGYPCYDSAKTALENLVLSKNVVLEKDVSDVDQYGRCLRYIFVGSTNVDVQLVKDGLAVARFYQPDVKYRTEITSAETYAEQNKIGCKWGSSTQTPN